MQDDGTASNAPGRDDELEVLFQDTATPVKKTDGGSASPPAKAESETKPKKKDRRSSTRPAPGRARVRPARGGSDRRAAPRPAPKPRGGPPRDAARGGPRRGRDAPPADGPRRTTSGRLARREGRPPSERLKKSPSERSRPPSERLKRPEEPPKRPPSERAPRPAPAAPPKEASAPPPPINDDDDGSLAFNTVAFPDEETKKPEPSSASPHESLASPFESLKPAETKKPEPPLRLGQNRGFYSAPTEPLTDPSPSPSPSTPPESSPPPASPPSAPPYQSLASPFESLKPAETKKPEPPLRLGQNRGFYSAPADEPKAESGPPAGSPVGTPITRSTAPLPPATPPPPPPPRTPDAPPPRDPPARNPGARPGSERAAILTARLPDRSSLRPPLIVVLYRRLPLVLGLFLTLILLAIGGYALLKKEAPPIAFLGIDTVPVWTNNPELTVSGRLNQRGQLKVGGATIATDSKGYFRRDLPLNEGNNSIVIEAGSGEKTATRILTVKLDTQVPRFEFEGRRKDRELTVDRRVLRGRVIEDNLAELAVDGEVLETDAEGRFEIALTPTSEVQALRLFARDKAGNQDGGTFRIRIETGLSFAALSELEPWTRAERLPVTGKLSGPAELSLDGAPVAVKSDGTFALSLLLRPGANRYELAARDADGGRARRSLSIIRDEDPPQVSLLGEGANGFVTINGQQLRGRVEDLIPARLRVDGREVTLAEDGRFEAPVKLGGEAKQVLLTAEDALGNRSARTITAVGPRFLGVSFDPPLSEWTVDAVLDLRGSANRGPITARIGERAAKSDARGRFRLRLPLREGLNRFELVLDDGRGIRITKTIDLRLDSKPPQLSLEGARAEDWVSLRGGALRGRLVEDHLKSLLIDGAKVRLDEDGAFAHPIALGEGVREVELLAVDLAGQRLRRRLIVGSPRAVADDLGRCVLLDAELWREAPEDARVAAVARVTRQLGSAYRFLGFEDFRCADQAFRIATFLHSKTEAVMHLIPGGRYQMGVQGGDPSAQPLHEVVIRPFLIGRDELKQREWDAVDGPDSRAFQGAGLPMDGVSWNDAQGWLSRAGGGLRLPSESEWEYACRAGSTARFFWGDRMDDRYAWHRGNSDQNFSRRRKTHPASEHDKVPNAFGLIDTLGNVWEWCQDSYRPGYEDGPATNAPRGGPGEDRVARGGSWRTDEAFCRSPRRFHYVASHRGSDVGLRLARSIDWPGEARARLRVGAARRDPMAVLANRQAWSRASAKLQDAAIAEVGKRLAPYFRLTETRVYEIGGARHRIATFLHERTGIRFQLLPGGDFAMGSNAGRDDEGPVHEVSLKPFLLSRTEVLQREWDVFGGADQRAFKGAALPIDSVSWEAIQPWLRRAGNGFRLPSETEWEYACRAGSETRYYWGQRWDDRYAWHRGNSDQNFSKTLKTHPSSEHVDRANAFGLIDMLGNVKEWCQDRYLTDYKTTPRTNAANEQGGGKRVVRGGSFFTERAFCRSAARYRHLPDHVFKDIGFRVAVSVPE